MSHAREILETLLRQRILILDGATGTMLQRLSLHEADFRGERFRDRPRQLQGNNNLLVATRPEVISNIHHQYLAAGADIIETNTFSSASIYQGDRALEQLVYELNVTAAQLAKEAAQEWTRRTPDKPRLVAGAIGPANRKVSEQVRGLVDGGCDLLLIETIIDTHAAKAAVIATEEVLEERQVDLPIMLSASLSNRSGRLLSGETIEAFWDSMAACRPFAVGLNCCEGPRDIRTHLAELARVSTSWISCYPSAGLPNAFGQYDESASEMAALMGGLAREGLVNIVGGCCGTTPDHIRAIAAAVKDMPPRRIKSQV